MMAAELEDLQQRYEQHTSRSILHQGYLHKKGQINRAWKKRYFILYSDKKLAYFTNDELINLPPINEIKLSTVKEVTLLPYSNKPKKPRNSRTLSLSGIFNSNKANKDSPTPDSRALSLRFDIGHDEHDYDDAKYENIQDDSINDDDECSYDHHDVYADALINTGSVCNRKYAFDLITEKRAYWLSCMNVEELNEWIIHLKYAIFGKRILNGYLTKKSKKKLKTKWKRRYIEVFESKIIRIYKNNKKTKVKQQIDLDAMSVSKIKYAESDIHHQPFLIEIYDKDGCLAHIFSADTQHIRDEFMNAFYITMNAHKINVLCEGALYFRTDDVKCWNRAYFALIEGSLLTFKDIISCSEFKNSIYSTDVLYNDAFDRYVVKSMAMNHPEIEKRDRSSIDNYPQSPTLSQSLKLFTIKTANETWYFGAEEATEFLFWCQSLLLLKERDERNSTVSYDHYDVFDERRNAFTFTNDRESKVKPEHIFMMDVNESLTALNDGEEKEESVNNEYKQITKQISMAALMAVKLDNKPTRICTVRSRGHVGGSQSLQLTPFSEKDLMFDTENDIDDSYKDSLENNEEKTNSNESENDDDCVYTTDSDASEESDRDCLESTITTNCYTRPRKDTEAHYIEVDDGY